MTDAAASTFTAERVASRLKARRAADRRFRYYGIIAIGIAMSALLLLVISIGSQAFSAATYHVVSYDIALEPDLIAPDGAAAPEDIARNVEGFYSAVRKNLVETFPEAGATPQLRREVAELITRLAVLPTARSVAANPEQIGKRITLRAPLNHDLDLFLKGSGVAQKTFAVGPLRVSREESNLKLSGDGVFGRIVPALAEAQARAGSEPLSVLVTAGAATGRLSEITASSAALEMLTGEPDALNTSQATVRLLLSPPLERNVSDRQIAWTLALKDMGRISRVPRWGLLTNTDSTYPELAGGLAAIVGSLLTMLVVAMVALPIGVLAAVYLEEFAPKNRLTQMIEVNINNLAAVPSIVFGLLGAALFLNFAGLPRSAPLVGGLVLALMTFPVVIIASRAALKAVPPSIRAGALAVGASPMQTVFHHVFPLAAPGMLTGAILGMARALGETAPLLLIGMVAFVGDVPRGPMDESTVMPVLIFSWANNAERSWEPMTAAMIVILLVFLLVMNGLVVFLRRKYERRW